ncbi:hypothetical protein J3R30DRAFT_3473889 [Lentinula aciculospora]|uniref:F-box domain-containing protein n=1 Tax=Lentinula aciculospora TaxID=153920 RepID=A0A9W9AEB2_9AGAR|nr:hypothetical protein J3R30DRAFT_3473889 [Lentinula aciculospora]
MTSSENNIHILPDEILCHIFLFVVARDLGEYSASELELSYVCSRWKGVALLLYPLWSSICVLAHEDPESEGVKRLTELYLERSGNHPLDLFLNIQEETSLLDLLYTQAHRWRRVHLVTTSYRDLGLTELRLLESLTLSLGDGPSIAACSHSYMWSNAPLLHTLSFGTITFDLEQFELPWHQLRHLTMECLDLDQMHKALCLCTSVVTAKFDSCTNDFSFRDPNPYTCLFLSSLTITADHRLETLGPDITHCIYPSLCTLTLIGGSQEFSFSHGIVPNITSLVIRSECHLTSLTLHGISYSSKHLMELLQLEKWLIKALIWLPTSAVADRTSVMSHSQVPGYLLPHLKEFGIRFPGSRRDIAIDRAKIGVVLNVIESRCPGSALGSHHKTISMGADRESNCPISDDKDIGVGTVLEKVHLGRLWSTRVPLEYEKRLRALEDNGLKITAL